MAQNETDPKNPADVFFNELKRAAVRAYYNLEELWSGSAKPSTDKSAAARARGTAAR